MSTLGDPLTDVAVMLAYQRLAERHAAPASAAIVTDAPLARRLPRPRRRARSATPPATGRDVSDIGFHLGWRSSSSR